MCSEPVQGLPACYWRQLVSRWMDRAFLTRYGGQDIYRLLGRDARREPLTALERAIFCACIEEHVVAERKPYAQMGVPSPED